jgi:hypothetical protein
MTYCACTSPAVHCDYFPNAMIWLQALMQVQAMFASGKRRTNIR